jgi:hypothetical protein
MNAASPADLRANGRARSIVVLGVLVALYVAVGVYGAAAFYRGYQPSADFYRVSDLVFPLLLAVWIDDDSRGRPEVTRPSFDLSHLDRLSAVVSAANAGARRLALDSRAARVDVPRSDPADADLCRDLTAIGTRDSRASPSDVFTAYPPELRARLLAVRRMIFT